MIFTVEENELLACYAPADDRLAMIKSIVKDTADMDEEIREIAESAVDKLAIEALLQMERGNSEWHM